jgi:hypothetical protein
MIRTRRIVAETHSDDRGEFRLGPLDPQYRPYDDVRIDAEGYATQLIANRGWTVYPATDTNLGRILLSPGRVFTGQVHDVDGNPLAGANVEFRAYRHYLGYTISDITDEQIVKTDSQGHFRTTPLPVGFLGLSVTTPGRQRAHFKQRVPIAPGGDEVLPPLLLENDVPIVGRVTDEQGLPLEGVVLEANSKYTGTSDGEGRFTLNGFGKNPNFQVHIKKPGFVFLNRVVTVSDEGFTWLDVRSDEREKHGPTKEWTVVMERLAWIEGHAIDAETGEPVHLDKVVLCTFERKPNGEILRAGCKNSNFEQPETGTFRVPYSQPDEYTLTFTAKGYLDAEMFTPLVKTLQPIEGLVIKLKRDGAAEPPPLQKQRIVGTATRDGRPIKTAWAALWTVRRPTDPVNAHIMRGRTATGDPPIYASAPVVDGKYSLDVPYQGLGWYVVVEEPGQALWQVGPFKVAPNENKTVDIDCKAGGVIHGTVADVPEQWKQQLWVVAFSRAAVRAEARVAADGTFRFDSLPPGRYGLKVGHDAYRDSEVPRPMGFKDIPASTWKQIADPWKRATMVTVESGKETEAVTLELPEEEMADSK